MLFLFHLPFNNRSQFLNKERVLAVRAENIDYFDAAHRQYYDDNKPRLIQYAKDFRLAHHQYYLEKDQISNFNRREQRRAYDYALKLEVFDHYSKGTFKCCRCGFADLRALSIDHINGGGTEHRKIIPGHKMYVWLRKNNYPEGFQVLCMNCNWIKRFENNEIQRRNYVYLHFGAVFDMICNEALLLVAKQVIA
jgi:hypothetical protein